MIPGLIQILLIAGIISWLLPEQTLLPRKHDV